ncbi:branched-chain amino acid ABC transporter ATP-binding protein/permease [Thermus sp.]|uniref:branched-chain amino acid ABC transporter ATP-binding protein/permease n=1 Tax=Thermus sp. TaxID=275 RepID=UPI00307E9821
MSLYLALFFALGLSLPFWGGEYGVSAGISILLYTVLAAAWALFTGPSRYLSLATSAFFGVGVYTVALLHEGAPWPLLWGLAFLLSGGLALLVGLATFRLQGVYFTVFTFGLAELVRQGITWAQRNLGGSVGSYVFLEVGQGAIYWALLALAALLYLGGAALGGSPWGLALWASGDDELAARHTGVPAARVRLLVFSLTAGAMGVAGAVVAPRWVYVDPSLAFNPHTSFLTAVIGLLGGLKEPMGAFLAAPPFVLVWDFLSGRFPHHATALMGLLFLFAVYRLPQGLLGLLPPRTPALPRGPVSRSQAPPSARPTGLVLEARGLSKRFGGVLAVAGLDLQVHPGEIVGLIGPNGSGKTTALGLIAGTLPPDGGEVIFLGRRVAGLPPEALARMGLGRTFQQVRLFPSLSVHQHVYLPLVLRGVRGAEEEARRILRRVGLEGQAHLFPSALTYLDQKRLELARALALDPKLLLLDEWLAGLSLTELAEGIDLLRSLREEGRALILVEHVMPAVRALCDRVYVLSFGELLAEGVPEEVLKDPRVVATYLGVAHA